MGMVVRTDVSMPSFYVEAVLGLGFRIGVFRVYRV